MLEEDGRLRNLRAENYILNQRISAEWIYASEEWKKEARQFCVKGLAEIDMLTEIQAKLEEAQREGLGLRQFKKKIVPYLQQKGWLGGDEEEIGRRVRIIFDTNLASARASAKWQKIQETKDRMPYLQYLPSLSADKRDEHKALYGLIARADDEIWQRIFPPNGYNCKCRTRQLTEQQAQKLIKEQEENGGRITVDNNAINKAVDSSFQHCHADLTGFNGYMVNRERTKEEKEQGKTEQQKKEENLKTAVALQKGMLEAQLANKILDLSPKTEKDYLGKFKENFGYPTMEDAFQALLEESREDFSKIEKRVARGVAEKETPFEVFEKILKDWGAEGGDKLGYIADNLPNGYREILDKAFMRIPKNPIRILNSMDRNIFVVSQTVSKYSDRAFHRFITNAETYKEVKNDFFGINLDRLQTGDSILYLPYLGKGTVWEQYYKNPTVVMTNRAIHEPIHNFQNIFPEIQECFRLFFEMRTNKEEEQPLEGYPADEKGKADKFPEPYYGKTYETIFFNKKTQPLELMTMSYQAILGENPQDLERIFTGKIEGQANFSYHHADKELLAFALTTLKWIAQ